MRLLISAMIIFSLLVPQDATSSQCGSPRAVEISFETTIVTSDNIPQQNLKIICTKDNEVLATSDEFGKVAFTLKTRIFPGCGFECGELNLIKETESSFEAWEIPISKWDGALKKEDRTILGQPLQKGERKNGLFNGQWSEWCFSNKWGVKNGKLRITGNYKDNIKDGEWTEWYCEGGKKSQGKYVNGKKEGVWTEWYDSGSYAGDKSDGAYQDGQISEQTEWHDGKLNGEWNKWHRNGKPSAKLKMRDDKPYGIHYEYRLDGKDHLYYDVRDPEAIKELNDRFEKSKPPQNAASIILTADKTELSDEEHDEVSIIITVKDVNGTPLKGQDVTSYDLPIEIFRGTGPLTYVMNGSTDDNGQSKMKIWRLSHGPINAQGFTIKVKSGKVISDPLTIFLKNKELP